MTDDLDDIKAMMDAATPRPDPARRAENLALAQENFDRLQGSRPAARPTSRPFLSGVKTMLDTLTTKGGLTATTALVACGFLFLTPGGQSLWQDGLPAPKAALPAPQPSTVAEPTIVTVEPDGTVTFAAPAEDRAEVGATAQARGQASDDADAATGARREALQSPTVETGEELAPEVMEAPVIALDAPAPSAALTDLSAVAGSLSRTRDGAAMALENEAFIAPDTLPAPEADTEAFAEAEANPLKVTADYPVSTFSIDVDTASYAVVRSSLMAGQLPPPAAVRVEEMINYFPYDYAAPEAGDAPFRPTVSTLTAPWNPNTRLVHIALQGQMPAIADRPPLNLVFLIDTSGSMNDRTKLPLLRQSLMLMLDQLRPEDQVAIVTYAGSAGVVLDPTPASEKGMIVASLMRLGAGGSTNGVGGLEQAYQVAERMAEEGEVSRVLLATDGDFNVGISDPEALKDYIADKRDTGTYLSVLGFGRGNLDDATMQALAQNGNGTAAYIDTLSEAQKVLVDQLTGALFPIAGDVKVQVEWNPAQIAEYRLIGYETRALRREDFNNDAVDAGELGAGHSVTALYEVTPVGSPAQLTDPLRYAADEAADPTTVSDEWGFLKLRYKDPGASVSQLIETPILPAEAGPEARFAAAIAGFAERLRGSDYLGDWSYADAITLANANRGEDPFGYRTEAVQLMRLADSLDQ